MTSLLSQLNPAPTQIQKRRRKKKHVQKFHVQIPKTAPTLAENEKKICPAGSFPFAVSKKLMSGPLNSLYIYSVALLYHTLTGKAHSFNT